MLHGIVALALSAALLPQSGEGADRLYGRVLTTGGEQLEGWLRWDRNETHWADFLDGNKEIPWAHLREREALDEEYRRRRERERSISLPGLRISWEEDDGPPPTTAAGVRFGHVRSIEVVDDGPAVVVLTSGEVVELRGGSTDIGRSFRGLVVEDERRGVVELRWRDLRRVDFLVAPPGRRPPAASRLFGTLRTISGVELTGYVAWDMDETLTTDVLDGDVDRRRREIPFGTIGRIAPEGRSAARVTLVTGEELVLSGTNDVNRDNRGIEISDPRLGRALVSWGELESVTFHAPDPGIVAAGRRDAFDGGRPLLGFVERRGGPPLEGHIRWDNDEASTWEVLDGHADGVEYGIELGFVHSIERAGDASRVTLRDGRTLLLEGSSDVSEENGGIFVGDDDGRPALVRWRDFLRVTFDR